MNVLIIPEHPQKDKYILKPLFQSLFRYIGKPHASVEVCERLILGGVSEALKKENIAQIVQQYQGCINIFILCVDRDADIYRCQQLTRLEQIFSYAGVFLTVNAWEELETWVLAGFKVESLRKELKLPRQKYSWKCIRAERDSKEWYFEPLAEVRGLADMPDKGYRQLGIEAARQVKQICLKCPEDFGYLVKRLKKIIKSQP